MNKNQESLFSGPQPVSVTDITRRIKRTLEMGFSAVSVQGEVSNFKRHTSGHMYFTLKDEGAQLSGVMWRSRVGSLSFTPQDGMKVIVDGRITVYEIRGNYQIEATGIRPVGIGDLQIAFENLKRFLAAEGIFDVKHKKLLPEYPERIGIVTSPTGAAIHDMLNVLRRRFPGATIILNPVKVQGSGAAQDIARAIIEFNEYKQVDVLIVGRGGGSFEDLWAFNEEVVARAIFGSTIPVISAVGHEIDFTIADFVADVRAATPSAAAELVVKDRYALLDIVSNYWYTMHQSMHTMLMNRRKNVLHLLKSYSFNRPIDSLRQANERVDGLQKGLTQSVTHRFEAVKTMSSVLQNRVKALDPFLVLRRGYTIVYRDNAIVGSGKRLHPLDEIDIKFHDGSVRSTVK